MTRPLKLVIGLVIFTSLANAAEVKVTLAQDKDGAKPTSAFAADTPTLFALFKVDGVKSGDKLRSVWIAEDVGAVAPKGTKIDEKTLESPGATANGTFSLGKPNNGWPAGKYKLEVYINENLASTTNFTVGSGKDVKKAPDSAGKVPNNDELKSMTNSAIVAFGEAINDKDFSGFYLDIASLWQEQTSAEKLGEAFKDFYDKELDLPAAIKGMEPVLDKPAKIDSDGVLLLDGHYPTKPNRIVFQLKYLTEEGDWKLVGINVQTKE